VGQQVFVAATAAIWPDGHVDDDVGVQCRRCLQIIEQALHEADATIRDVVRTRVFLLDPQDGEAVSAIHGEIFGEIRPLPASSSFEGSLIPLASRDRGRRHRRQLNLGALG